MLRPLASPAARFINGDLMVIDGGQAQWGVVWPAGSQTGGLSPGYSQAYLAASSGFFCQGAFKYFQTLLLTNRSISR